VIEVDINKLAVIPVEERVLLLPHCLRHSNTCKAKYSKLGLECAECNPECAINCLRSAALSLGYKGVCVAPGGRLAVNYINDHRPQAIIAIACDKELEEGIGSVDGITKDAYSPVLVILPLSRDGCVDTEVDVESALAAINAGYDSLKVSRIH
jgi:hypothetical protein